MVAGIGISRADAELCNHARFFLVRGPETAKAIARCGGKPPELFGDPGILLPLLLPGKRDPKGKVGFITHHKHSSLQVRLRSYFERIDVMQSRAPDIERFVRKLLGCDCVITSAMHPFIVCQAYGIPCGLINFRNEPVHGDGIKYKDYLLGVDLPYKAPTIVPTDLSHLDVHNFVRDDRVDSEIQKRVYTALHSALEYLRRRE